MNYTRICFVSRYIKISASNQIRPIQFGGGVFNSRVSTFSVLLSKSSFIYIQLTLSAMDGRFLDLYFKVL